MRHTAIVKINPAAPDHEDVEALVDRRTEERLQLPPREHTHLRGGRGIGGGAC